LLEHPGHVTKQWIRRVVLAEIRKVMDKLPFIYRRVVMEMNRNHVSFLLVGGLNYFLAYKPVTMPTGNSRVQSKNRTDATLAGDTRA
jgi:hypothetical protein